MNSVAQATVTETATELVDGPANRVVLNLSPPLTSSRREVTWTADTVDNEHMGKKMSKCCCIYVKPRAFSESSTESDDEDCDHCRGHVEKKKRKKVPGAGSNDSVPSNSNKNSDGSRVGSGPEPQGA